MNCWLPSFVDGIGANERSELRPQTLELMKSILGLASLNQFHYISLNSYCAGAHTLTFFLDFDAGPNPQQIKRKKKLRQLLNSNEINKDNWFV